MDPEEFTNQLDDLQSGTLIIWSDLDRVLPLQTAETDDNAKCKFSDSLNNG